MFNRIINSLVIKQGSIKLIKSDSKDIYNVTKDFLIQINADLFYLQSNKNSFHNIYI